MKKYTLVLCIILCIALNGCGKTDTSSTSTSLSSGMAQNNAATPVPDNTGKKDNIQNNGKQEETASPAVPDETPQETPSGGTSDDKTETFDLSEDTPYKDSEHSVKILGLKEYKSLKSDLYTDKPKKGNKFLVLFLAVANNTGNDEYINVNYLSAKVDGKKIENSFLVNEPKNYATIFTNIAAGKRKAGFIVWEVPSGWKKFNMVYDGWTYTSNFSIKCKFTPKDLSDPPMYSQDVLF